MEVSNSPAHLQFAAPKSHNSPTGMLLQHRNLAIQYVAVKRWTKYFPLLIPSYFLSVSAAYVPGMASMWLLKLGLQK